MEDNKISYKKQLLYVFPMMGILFAIYLVSNQNNREIDNEQETTDAFILRIEKSSMGQRYVFFEFEYKNEIIKCFTTLPHKGFCKRGDCFDKKFKVEFSSKNPHNCRIIIEGKAYKGSKKLWGN